MLSGFPNFGSQQKISKIINTLFSTIEQYEKVGLRMMYQSNSLPEGFTAKAFDMHQFITSNSTVKYKQQLVLFIDMCLDSARTNFHFDCSKEYLYLYGFKCEKINETDSLLFVKTIRVGHDVDVSDLVKATKDPALKLPFIFSFSDKGLQLLTFKDYWAVTRSASQANLHPTPTAAKENRRRGCTLF